MAGAPAVRLARARGPPAVDPRERLAHQERSVALGQAIGDAKRLDAVAVGEEVDRARPVGSPEAAIEPEGVEDPPERIPDVAVRERLVGQRAGTADLHD